MTEARLNAEVVKALRGIGAFAMKIHGCGYQEHSVDILGCYNGRAFAIEGKLKGDATPAQWTVMRRWQAAGAIVGVYHSVDEALDLVTK